MSDEYWIIILKYNFINTGVKQKRLEINNKLTNLT